MNGGPPVSRQRWLKRIETEECVIPQRGTMMPYEAQSSPVWSLRQTKQEGSHKATQIHAPEGLPNVTRRMTFRDELRYVKRLQHDLLPIDRLKARQSVVVHAFSLLAPEHFSRERFDYFTASRPQNSLKQREPAGWRPGAFAVKANGTILTTPLVHARARTRPRGRLFHGVPSLHFPGIYRRTRRFSRLTIRSARNMIRGISKVQIRKNHTNVQC